MLETRVEAMERELNVTGHHRSLSDASTISFQENSRGSPDGTASVNNVEVSVVKVLSDRSNFYSLKLFNFIFVSCTRSKRKLRIPSMDALVKSRS